MLHNLFLFLLAIVASAVAVMRGNRKFSLWGIISYVLYAASILLSLGDMLRRINANDIAGVLDIYPAMGKIWAAGLVIITVLNIIALIRQRKE